ncbi:hypothetical protein GJ496_003529 [Pomphorhynchus laevis]|nr:hypothetical protein GJ496_003529 [Pomphorhynchus laevis]
MKIQPANTLENNTDDKYNNNCARKQPIGGATKRSSFMITDILSGHSSEDKRIKLCDDSLPPTTNPLRVDDEKDNLFCNNEDQRNFRKKKTRTVFSRNQVYQLERMFDCKRYLSSSERSSLAISLRISETQVKIWFQNRRNKWKRQTSSPTIAAAADDCHCNNSQLKHRCDLVNGSEVCKQQANSAINVHQWLPPPHLYPISSMLLFQNENSIRNTILYQQHNSIYPL